MVMLFVRALIENQDAYFPKFLSEYELFKMRLIFPNGRLDMIELVEVNQGTIPEEHILIILCGKEISSFLRTNSRRAVGLCNTLEHYAVPHH